MSEKTILIVSSLLAVLLAAFHISDDIVRGFEKGGPDTYTAIVIMVVWVYATLVAGGTRLGLVIVLVGSVLGAGVPYLHMRGPGMVGGRVANTSGMFFWVFTLLALGVTSSMAGILAARALWRSVTRTRASVGV